MSSNADKSLEQLTYNPTNRGALGRWKLKSPCPVRWDAMEGDDRTRFCSQCQFNVHNLSEMTETEAGEFLRTANGRTCVNYLRRPDGSLVTRQVLDRPARPSRYRFGHWLLQMAAVYFGLTAIGCDSDHSNSLSGPPDAPSMHPGSEMGDCFREGGMVVEDESF